MFCPLKTAKERKNQCAAKDAPAHWEVKVYALVDPRDETVRYVGVTEGDLSGRLAVHVAKPTNFAVARWITELRSVGMVPRIEELCRGPHSSRNFVERSWIFWILQRWELTNRDPGGVVRDPDGNLTRIGKKLRRNLEHAKALLARKKRRKKHGKRIRESQRFHEEAIARSGVVKVLTRDEIAAIYGGQSK